MLSSISVNPKPPSLCGYFKGLWYNCPPVGFLSCFDCVPDSAGPSSCSSRPPQNSGSNRYPTSHQTSYHCTFTDAFFSSCNPRSNGTPNCATGRACNG